MAQNKGFLLSLSGRLRFCTIWIIIFPIILHRCICLICIIFVPFKSAVLPTFQAEQEREKSTLYFWKQLYDKHGTSNQWLEAKTNKWEARGSHSGTHNESTFTIACKAKHNSLWLMDQMQPDLQSNCPMKIY